MRTESSNQRSSRSSQPQTGRSAQNLAQDQGWMRFFRTETGPLDLWANARLIGGPPMRPAARRATTQQAGRTTHGRPPLSFAPARRRPGAPWGGGGRLYRLHVGEAGSARELAGEHAYPGREAAERNECMRAIARLLSQYREEAGGLMPPASRSRSL